MRSSVRTNRSHMIHSKSSIMSMVRRRARWYPLNTFDPLTGIFPGPRLRRSYLLIARISPTGRSSHLYFAARGRSSDPLISRFAILLGAVNAPAFRCSIHSDDSYLQVRSRARPADRSKNSSCPSSEIKDLEKSKRRFILWNTTRDRLEFSPTNERCSQENAH
jgi:hypothetical protein